MVLEAETCRIGQVDLASVPSHVIIIGLAGTVDQAPSHAWSPTSKMFLLCLAMPLRMILTTSADPRVLRLQRYTTLSGSPAQHVHLGEASPPKHAEPLCVHRDEPLGTLSTFALALL